MGVFLPGASALRGAPRCSASLGPASGQTDRRTMGPGPQLGPAGPGLSGTGPRQAEGGFEPSRWRGAEGRRCRRTKPTADRQTEGEKMATRAAGARCSRTRSEWGACTSLSSLPPSPGWSPSPLPRRAPSGVGGALGERGSGEAGLKGASNHRCVRGGLASILAHRRPPSLASSLVFLQPRQPLRSPILSWTCELRPDSSDTGFLPYL